MIPVRFSPSRNSGPPASQLIAPRQTERITFGNSLSQKSL
jgi:hypothetical protein